MSLKKQIIITRIENVKDKAPIFDADRDNDGKGISAEEIIRILTDQKKNDARKARRLTK